MEKDYAIEQIKNIIRYEFTKLLNNIEGDFSTNYNKKNRNFILNFSVY